MAAPQNPPFLGRVCFPPAENCSDRGAFCARRVEQQVVRAYPSSASGEHAVVCKCRAKFIKIWGFENVGFQGPEHGTHHLPVAARRIEAPHHQVLEGRTRKLELKLAYSRLLTSSAETAIAPFIDDLPPAPPSPDGLLTHCPAHATFPMVLGTAGATAPRPRLIFAPLALSPPFAYVGLRWPGHLTLNGWRIATTCLCCLALCRSLQSMVFLASSSALHHCFCKDRPHFS